MSDWLDQLRMEVEASSKAAVARRMDVSRTTISLLCGGNYGAKTDRMRERFEVAFDHPVECPHLGAKLARVACEDMRSRPMPANDPRLLRHWTACKSCPLNPVALSRCHSHREDHRDAAS